MKAIKTAEEILFGFGYYPSKKNTSEGDLLIKAMKEYAEQFVPSEIIECECGHSVPAEYVYTDSEGYETCTPCMTEHLLSEIRVKSIEFTEWVSVNFWVRDPFPNKHTDRYMWTKVQDDALSEEPLEIKTIGQLYGIYLDDLDLEMEELQVNVSELEKTWDSACKKTLENISKTFLDEGNLSKVDHLNGIVVMEAVGKTIKNFPIPDYGEFVKERYEKNQG